MDNRKGSMETKQLVINRLNKIEKQISQLKKQIIDEDSIMTEEHYAALLGYRKDKAEGKLISHEEMKKQLGI